MRWPASPFGSGVDPAALDERVVEFLDDGRLQVRHAFGQAQQEGQAPAGQHGRAPQHRVLAGRRFLDLQIRRPGLVSLRRRHRAEQHEQQRQGAGGDAAQAHHFDTAPEASGPFAIGAAGDAAADSSGGPGSSTV